MGQPIFLEVLHKAAERVCPYRCILWLFFFFAIEHKCCYTCIKINIQRRRLWNHSYTVKNILLRLEVEAESCFPQAAVAVVDHPVWRYMFPVSCLKYYFFGNIFEVQIEQRVFSI